jgi:hypothetical protein
MVKYFTMSALEKEERKKEIILRSTDEQNRSMGLESTSQDGNVGMPKVTLRRKISTNKGKEGKAVNTKGKTLRNKSK